MFINVYLLNISLYYLPEKEELRMKNLNSYVLCPTF